MSLAISFAALALSLGAFLHGRWRDKRDLLLRIVDELIAAEREGGRRLLYAIAKQQRRVQDLTPDEFIAANNAINALDLLSIYYRRRYVSRRDVLELWAKPIIEVLPAAEAFLAYRDARVKIKEWPAMRVICRDAERYLKRHGLTVPGASPAQTPTDPGTECAK